MTGFVRDQAAVLIFILLPIKILLLKLELGIK